MKILFQVLIVYAHVSFIHAGKRHIALKACLRFLWVEVWVWVSRVGVWFGFGSGLGSGYLCTSVSFATTAHAAQFLGLLCVHKH